MPIKKKEIESTEAEAVPTLLFSVSYPDVFAVTESGKVVKVAVTEKQKKDPIFWSILKKIKNNKIWIPLSKSQNKMFDDDWLAVE